MLQTKERHSERLGWVPEFCSDLDESGWLGRCEKTLRMVSEIMGNVQVSPRTSAFCRMGKPDSSPSVGQ